MKHRDELQTTDEEAALLDRLSKLTQVMDSAIRVPGTRFMVGLDPILGLLPVAGDVASMGVSSYLVWEARRLGLPRHVLIRMLGNVALDATLGAIPLLGDAFDVVFRANKRNMRLIEKSLKKRARKRERAQ